MMFICKFKAFQIFQILLRGSGADFIFFSTARQILAALKFFQIPNSKSQS